MSFYLSGRESGRPDDGVEEVAGVAQLGRHLQDAPHEHLKSEKWGKWRENQILELN